MYVTQMVFKKQWNRKEFLNKLIRPKNIFQRKKSKQKDSINLKVLQQIGDQLK